MENDILTEQEIVQLEEEFKLEYNKTLKNSEKVENK